MPRLSRLFALIVLSALLFACSPFPVDLTPALTEREQQLCNADVKGGQIAECMPPYNVQSSQLALNDTLRAKGATAAWCTQYDFAERDKADMWISRPDTVLVTELQDGTLKYAPIGKLPPEGCSGYTAS